AGSSTVAPAARGCARALRAGRGAGHGLGRRVVARGGARGGELIPPAHAIGSRLATALVALAVLGGVVAYATAAGDRLPELVAGVGVAGCVVTVVALAGCWPSIVSWGVAGVGAAYAVFLSLRSGTVDSRAPIVAAGFFT